MTMVSFKPPHTNTIIDAIEAAQPAAFKAFYPRNYEGVGGYYSPRLVAANLATIFAYSVANKNQDLTIVENLIAPSLHYLATHKMPLMFLDPKFLEAVLQTDFPEPISWVDLKLPYEHGIFMVPRGGLKTPEDNDIAFIHYSRKHKGEVYPIPGRHDYTVTLTTISISSFSFATDTWYNSNLAADQTPMIKLTDLYYGYGGHAPAFDNRSVNPLFDKPLNSEDEDFVKRVGTVVFGTVLALNARQNLLQPAKLLRTVLNKHNHKRTQYWSPNIIGKGYTPPHHKAHATHASPRMHWRRGHFRSQAFGVGRADRKIIWIEPCLVAGDTK